MSLHPNEVIIILILALIILGPDHLPGAVRKFGKVLGDLRRMSDGFQSEIRHAFEDADEEAAAKAAGVATYSPPDAQPASSMPDIEPADDASDLDTETPPAPDVADPGEVPKVSDSPEEVEASIADTSASEPEE